MVKGLGFFLRSFNLIFVRPSLPVMANFLNSCRMERVRRERTETRKRNFKKPEGLSSRKARVSWLFNKQMSNAFKGHIRRKGRKEKKLDITNFTRGNGVNMEMSTNQTCLFVALLFAVCLYYSSKDTLQLNEKPSTCTHSTSKLKTFYRLVNLQLRWCSKEQLWSNFDNDENNKHMARFRALLLQLQCSWIDKSD